MNTTIKKLQIWYHDQCDGKWEHSWGIKINTLDNPGWSIKIDLNETKYEDSVWEDLFIDNGDDDWISCGKESKMFRGIGDPTKLEDILNYFLTKVSDEGSV